jgi:hypothetical protein
VSLGERYGRGERVIDNRVGRRRISACVRESTVWPWHKAPGPTTPFSASNDAENGSSGPNRNIHIVSKII